MNKKTNFVACLLLGLSLLAAGCGGDKTESSAESGSSGSGDKSASSSVSEEVAKNAREIVIEANDQMKFSVERFAVKGGEAIRLVLDNVGSMPKFSMGHNVVVLKRDVDAAAFVEDAAMAAGNEYIPAGRESEIVAHTPLLGGGEKASVTFVAPEEAGEYPFVCSFPGHFQIGMRGVMVVE